MLRDVHRLLGTAGKEPPAGASEGLVARGCPPSASPRSHAGNQGAPASGSSARTRPRAGRAVASASPGLVHPEPGAMAQGAAGVLEPRQQRRSSRA